MRPPLEVLAYLLDNLDDIKVSFSSAPLVSPSSEEEEGAAGRQVGVAMTEEFRKWSHRTGELQRVPALETVDLPGEKEFTEGCLKVEMIYPYVFTKCINSIFLFCCMPVIG